MLSIFVIPLIMAGHKTRMPVKEQRANLMAEMSPRDSSERVTAVYWHVSQARMKARTLRITSDRTCNSKLYIKHMSPGTQPHTNDGQMMKWPTSRQAQSKGNGRNGMAKGAA